jgi:hypothetical protein
VVRGRGLAAEPSAAVHRGSGKFYRALREQLLVYARAHFRLTGKGPGTAGDSLADGLDDAARFYRGSAPAIEAELELPDLPDEVSQLWSAFQRLSNRRPRGLALGPIPYSEICAFEHLEGYTFTPWEVEVIEALDGEWLADQAARSAKPAETPPKAPDAGR